MSDPAVHPAAPPNHLSDDELRLRPDASGGVAVDPTRAGWRYLSFEAIVLEPGVELDVGDPRREVALVTLAGGIELDLEGRRVTLPGRTSVWTGPPWAAYLPAGTAATAQASGERAVAIRASAPASGREGVNRVPIMIGPEDVTVEVRGAGNATRQINHIIAPGFPADRLLLVEVYTPSGNWSSWPPHKHDVDEMPDEAVLEEIYYYQFRRPEAWAVQRLYRRDGSRDALWSVRHGELVLVTDGYHPFVATHGDDAYYLNALAGDRRTMACSFDPDLDWVRKGWADMPIDPRVPVVRP